MFFLALGIFCAAAIAVNVVVRRVPVHDANAESDIGAIAGAIDSYAMEQGMLPSDLTQLSGLSAATKKRLPSYDYVPAGLSQYQLCATFLAPGQNQSIPKPYNVANGYADPANHGKGRECFTYQVTQNYPMPLKR